VLETVSHETSQLQSEVVRQRPERQIRRPIRYGVAEYADTVSCDKEQQADHMANVCQIVEPATMEEALSGKHANDWKRATDSEYESLIKNETWKLVEIDMEKPDGYIQPGQEHLICKLQKSLYMVYNSHQDAGTLLFNNTWMKFTLTKVQLIHVFTSRNQVL